MSVLSIYQVIVGIFVLALALNAAVNFLFFRRPRAYVASGADKDLPMVSVLVPARDEEGTITACIESLLAQNYPRFEVVALDDGSADDTYALLCRLRDRDPRLRVLVGAELPEGWNGKPHACWQLANAAFGDFLLFTDADCVLDPDALMLALGAVQMTNSDAVSLLPDLLCEGFWEKLIIPVQHMILFAFLPTLLVRNSRHPWFAAAHGAFIFLHRDTYFSIDGHRAVRNQLSEDIKFAQHIKREGKTLWYGDGSRAYAVRMYDGLSAIWNGFTKNIYGAFSYNLPLLACVLVFVTCVFVLPPLWVVWGLWRGTSWTWIPAASYLALAGVRLGLTSRFGRDDAGYALLNPLAWGLVVGIALSSIRATLSSTVEWKGRKYGRPS